MPDMSEYASASFLIDSHTYEMSIPITTTTTNMPMFRMDPMKDDDEMTLLRAVFFAMVNRYGIDGTLTILDDELPDDRVRFIVEDVDGGIKVHVLPEFVKV
jgi:hypothetical protein